MLFPLSYVHLLLLFSCAPFAVIRAAAEMQKGRSGGCESWVLVTSWTFASAGAARLRTGA